VVENFAPGALERMGLGLSELRRRHPRLITASISLFGHSDSGDQFAARHGLAIVAEAESGIVNQVPGAEIAELGFALGDHAAGHDAFGGIMMALFARERDDCGSHVEISMARSLMSFNASAITSFSLLGAPSPLRAGVYGYFPAKDGHVAIGLTSDEQWFRFVSALDQQELLTDPRFQTPQQRYDRSEEIQSMVASWTSPRSVREVMAQMEAARIPCGHVNSAGDVVSSQQFRDRGLVLEIDDGGGGRVAVPANPFGQPISHRSLPRLGQDTIGVLTQQLEYSAAEVDLLRVRGAFGATEP
jgi:crotonobetainyl-CoA:carnitine CoA-transferase CaiB-like acyl-CoA transferase